jgi:polysaccharide export outer membrane protein
VVLFWVVTGTLRAQDKPNGVVPDLSSKTIVSATKADLQPPLLQHRNPRYQLCVSDVLDLDFPFTPEFNQTVTVQPDGYISLRGMEALYVEGKTLPELTQMLQGAYGKILHDPVISIVLKDFAKPYFIVGGQVSHPGKFELRGDTTVVQALEIAGDFNEDAKHSQVYLFRRVSNDWVETRKLDVKKMLHKGNLAEDLHLQPGDMLYVPKSAMAKIKRYIPAPSVGTFLSPAQF